MHIHWIGKLPVLVGAIALCCLAVGLTFRSPAAIAGEAQEDKKSRAPQPAGDGKVVTVGEARERAKLLHNIYAATLDVMHHHFFRREQPVLPARALEEVFDEMSRQSNIKAAWIAVNAKAMSIHHEPKSDFEKNAARAIAAGKGEFEVIENGYYHRAGAIPLGDSCISCHTGFFSKAPQTKRFAGLVISVPINQLDPRR